MNFKSIGITRRGLILVYTTLILTPTSIISRDPVLALITTLLISILILDFIGLMFRARRVCGVVFDRSMLRMYLGDVVQVNGRISCNDVVNVKSGGLLRVRELRFSSSPELLVDVEGLHIGFYDIRGLDVIRSSPLSLYTFTSRASTKLVVRVTPRVTYLLMLAYEILAGRSLEPGFSELESIIRGDSGVYVYTREYMPGDRLRRVDWKATARRSKLMVKEYRLELGGLSLIALDLRCFGELTCDNIASAALLTTITGYSEDRSVSVLELDTGRVLEMSYKELLTYIISRVLEPEITGKLELHTYIPPLTLKELERIAMKLGHKKVIEREVPLTTEGATVIITPLITDTSKILDIVDRAIRTSNQITIVTPKNPWLDTSSIEEAYITYTTYSKITSKLKNMGVNVYTCCPLTKL